jgi:hypothetical protein
VTEKEGEALSLGSELSQPPLPLEMGEAEVVQQCGRRGKGRKGNERGGSSW